MNSDIKYYKPITAAAGPWPVLSHQSSDGKYIVGFYQNRKWCNKAGWIYLPHSYDAINSYGEYIEITEAEADREIFLHEL